MFILPTYLGTREVAPIRSAFPLLADTADTEPLRLWNRLFCPQCILNIVAGNTVVVSAFRTVNEPSRRCTMQGLCRLGLEFFSMVLKTFTYTKPNNICFANNREF